jgi:hypothetical protein
MAVDRRDFLTGLAPTAAAIAPFHPCLRRRGASIFSTGSGGAIPACARRPGESARPWPSGCGDYPQHAFEFIAKRCGKPERGCVDAVDPLYKAMRPNIGLSPSQSH